MKIGRMVDGKKLKYWRYIMEPSIYHKEYDGWFVCGCGYQCDTQNITHCCRLLKGYCNNGMRAIDGNKYQCVCGKIIDNPKDGHRHSRSGLCVEKARKYVMFTCKICDVSCESKYYFEKHKKTQRHLDKINDPLKCNICDIRCTTSKKLDEHFKTKKHLARVECPKLDLECKTCNIKCLSQKQMLRHLETKKHKKHNGA